MNINYPATQLVDFDSLEELIEFIATTRYVVLLDVLANRCRQAMDEQVKEHLLSGS